MRKNNLFINKKGIIFLGIIPFLLSSCNNKINISHTYFKMDTFIDVNYSSLDDSLLVSISELLDKYDLLFNSFTSSINNVYTLNHSEEEIELDQDLIDILKLGDSFNSLTEGKFNLFTYELSNLWKEAVENNEFPDSSLINELKNNLDNSSIVFNNNKVNKLGNASIDLGAIAKGFALNKIKGLLKEYEITNYLINAGSSSIIFGEKDNDDKNYKVRIKNQDYYLELSNISLATSSIYEQGYIEKDDKKYSHIINPLTGYAECINTISIVIGDDPTICDVLSTVGIISTLDEIIKLENSFNGYHFICFNDSEVIYGNEYLSRV